ncbi:MAG: hypothetical protein MZU97_14105 [Bacillus subtilis]|nr:hypothetical protein [Bacillus subtilis]
MKTGSASLRITTTDNEFGYAYQYITLDEGIHDFTVDVKNCGNDDDVYVYIDGNIQYAENGGVWRRLTFTIFVDDPDTLIQIRLRSNTAGNVYFDNIRYYKDLESE